jgi:iron complex transport system permease protein
MLGLMSIGLVLLILADLVTGPSSLTVGEAVLALGQGPASSGLASTILWSIRLPITLMGLLVGVALGIAGLQMQTILDNPLASPFTLGFSAAAGFGAALSIMFGAAIPLPAWLLTPIAAFGATLTACFLMYSVARARGTSPEILTLGGIAVMFLFQAAQSLLQYLASPEVLQQIVFWLFGSLMKSTWTSVSVVAAVMLVTLPILAKDAWKLMALRLGSAHARSLGINDDALRRRTFILIALLTAAAVSFVGTIGFIGLVAPHAARALVGEDQRILMPMAGVTGGALLVAASVISKVIAHGAVIPVGIVTAVVGVPVLFALVMRSR